MANNGADRQVTTLFENPVDPVDPHAYLSLRMRVIGGQSKSLGTVETLERDSGTGRLKALTVRHGLLRRTLTSIPADRVKWVNQDSVVLDYSSARFKALPTADRR
jgi:sporulation protein YlmC with PRC-barrel domain